MEIPDNTDPAAADGAPYEDQGSGTEFVPAQPGERIAAFLVDAMFVPVVISVLARPVYSKLDWHFWALPVAIFVLYDGVSIWLTGTTLAKSALGLRVDRVGDRKRGLLWSAGRAGVGYLVLDGLLLLGLLALIRGRTCPHDRFYGSQVVRDTRAKRTLEATSARMKQFREELVSQAGRLREPLTTALKVLAFFVLLASPVIVWTSVGWSGLLRWIGQLLQRLLPMPDVGATSTPGGGSASAAAPMPVTGATGVVALGFVAAGFATLSSPSLTTIDACRLVSLHQVTKAMSSAGIEVEHATWQHWPEGSREGVAPVNTCGVPGPAASDGSARWYAWLLVYSTDNPTWSTAQQDGRAERGVGDEAYYFGYKSTSGNPVEVLLVRDGGYVFELDIAKEDEQARAAERSLARQIESHLGRERYVITASEPGAR